MEKAGIKSEWKPIASAPSDIDLELSVHDMGEFHVLAFPCRHEDSGWRDVRLDRLVPVKPTHWRKWQG